MKARTKAKATANAEQTSQEESNPLIVSSLKFEDFCGRRGGVDSHKILQAMKQLEVKRGAILITPKVLKDIGSKTAPNKFAGYVIKLFRDTMPGTFLSYKFARRVRSEDEVYIFRTR